MNGAALCCQLWRWARDQADRLNGVEAKALQEIAGAIAESGAIEAPLSYSQLAERVGSRRNSMVAAVCALEEKGLIEQSRTPGSHANRYQVPWFTALVRGSKIEPVPSSKIEPLPAGSKIEPPATGSKIELPRVANKATSSAKQNSRAPVPHSLTRQRDCREEKVSECAEIGPVSAIVQTLKERFQLAVMPGDPKLAELLALAQTLEVPLEALPDYLRDLRARRRADYQFTLGLIVLAAQGGGLETWKLQRKPPGRAASRFERPPLEDAPEEPVEVQIRRCDDWLEAMPNHPDADLWRARRAALLASAPPLVRSMGAGG